MLWQIAKKDFLSNLISARFIVGFILCLFLIPFSIIINLEDYKEQVRLYQLDRDNAEKAMDVFPLEDFPGSRMPFLFLFS